MGSIQTGLAITNLGTSSASINFALNRLDGTATGLTGNLTMQGNGQTALFLNQIPGFASVPSSFKGVLRMQSTVPISIVGLRGRYNERSDFLITTTAPSNEASPFSNGFLYFPHLVDSGGYTTQFIIMSGQLTQSPAGVLELFSQSGQPLSLGLQ